MNAIIILCLYACSHIGVVFRRNNTGQTNSSGNGVGTDPIGWQGYEVVTGRINSQNLGGFLINFYFIILMFGISDFIVSVPRSNAYRGRVSHIVLL